MLNKTFYVEQTPKLKKYLVLIFKNAQITNDLKNNEQLQNALEECLHILNTFEIQLKAKKNSAIEFADKFNTETKKDMKLRELDYQDEYEYIDQINWLVVYCKNQYHIDLMNHSSHVESSNEIIEQTPAQQKRDQIISEAIGADVEASKIIELNNRMINSSKQLTQDITTGKIYIYKSKPAIMPIINLLFMYSFAILSIFAFVTSLMYFVAGGMNLDKYDSTNSDVFSWVNGLVLFVFSGFMIYASVKSFIFWYKKKNTNARYYMNWMNNLLTFIFLALCILMIVINVTNKSDQNNFWVTCFYIFFEVLKTSANHGVVWTLIISLSCLIVFLLISLTLLIIGIVKNPKRDDKKIEDLYKEYLRNEPVKLD